jgi:hypothetical protein
VNEYDGPERRKVPPLVSMDAALLADQNQRLDRLNASIEDLAEAVKGRPTKLDLEATRKRLRDQLIITILLFAVVCGGLVWQQGKTVRACDDRNSNTEKFRILIAVLVQEGENRGQTPINDALKDYLTTLKTVDC